MAIWNKTRNHYKKQDARQRAYDDKDYDMPQCPECGGAVMPRFGGNGRMGLCPTCEKDVEFVKVPMSQVEAFRATLTFGKALPAAVSIAYIAPQPEKKLTKVITWNEAMQQREQDFNRRYYNNPDGLPEWNYKKRQAEAIARYDDGLDDAVIGGVER